MNLTRSGWLRAGIVGLAVVVGASVGACGDDDDPPANNNNGNANNNDNGNANNNNALGNIVQVATDAGTFGTLLGLAVDTGLDAVLGDDTATLTAFAPTDAAFTALGVDTTTVSDDVIENILRHHVVDGDLPGSVVATSTTVTSLANLDLMTDGSGDPILVGGATLSATIDVPASNGRIHIMDEVIVPPTIVEVAVATSTLSTLVAALQAATLVDAVDPDTLTGEAPITVFAPTNDAFEAAGVDLNDPPENLVQILTYHVAGGQLVAEDLTDGLMITTVEGGTIEVDVAMDGSISLIDEEGNSVSVIASDIRTLTGVVHLIDGVLMPESDDD